MKLMIKLNKTKYLSIVIVLLLITGCQSGINTAKNVEQDNNKPGQSSIALDKQNDPEIKPVAEETHMGRVTAVRLADPASGWVGGEGWIARTDDGGQKWQVQYQDAGTVYQLFALDSQKAWAALSSDRDKLNDGCLLCTVDGGTHWTPVGMLPNPGFFHFVSPEQVFCANAQSTDGGKTWTTLPIPPKTVGDAYFHDADHGWAVTQPKKDRIEVRRTTDGGKSWQVVMSRKTAGPLCGAIIRSAGRDDAWVECIGDSGMSQTSYSLFHTSDGGWLTVIADSTAGAGPAPGFPLGYNEGPRNAGASPGTLYVVNTKVAFMGGQCQACDNPNTIGWTTDGGKTWTNGEAEFGGHGQQLLAIADAACGWWICTDYAEASVMYTTSDGGKHWQKVYTFDRPKRRLS